MMYWLHSGTPRRKASRVSKSNKPWPWVGWAQVNACCPGGEHRVHHKPQSIGPAHMPGTYTHFLHTFLGPSHHEAAIQSPEVARALQLKCLCYRACLTPKWRSLWEKGSAGPLALANKPQKHDRNMMGHDGDCIDCTEGRAVALRMLLYRENGTKLLGGLSCMGSLTGRTVLARVAQCWQG